MGYYSWQSLILPLVVPMRMLEPRRLPLSKAWEIDAKTAEFLSFGIGPVDPDLRWMWRWDSDGLVRLFRSWTGFEMGAALPE